MTAVYDLILKGGHVIDPANAIDTPMDVAVTGDRIAAIAPDIPSGQGLVVVSLEGLIVTPGLVDIHVHAFGGFEGWLVMDAQALRNGVTTARRYRRRRMEKVRGVQEYGDGQVYHAGAGLPQHRRCRHGRRRGAGRFRDGSRSLRPR